MPRNGPRVDFSCRVLTDVEQYLQIEPRADVGAAGTRTYLERNTMRHCMATDGYVRSFGLPAQAISSRDRLDNSSFHQ